MRNKIQEFSDCMLDGSLFMHDVMAVIIMYDYVKYGAGNIL